MYFCILDYMAGIIVALFQASLLAGMEREDLTQSEQQSELPCLPVDILLQVCTMMKT